MIALVSCRYQNSVATESHGKSYKLVSPRICFSLAYFSMHTGMVEICILWNWLFTIQSTIICHKVEVKFLVARQENIIIGNLSYTSLVF